MKRLEDYQEIVVDEVIFRIHNKMTKLYGKHVVHVNSTYQGGGVAEMLSSLVPLMNDIGLDAGWRILHGNPDFFGITKKFHNALQGDPLHFTHIKRDLYLNNNEDFSQFTHLDHDACIIHDPQPLPLVRFYKKRQPWIWRCHIDLTDPNQRLWNFLKSFILKYDLVIVSNEKYLRKDLPVKQIIIPPAIDPLSPKNKPLTDYTIQKTMKKFRVPLNKPILTQISRFDKWKDPEGVIDIYREVRKVIDCRLVLCGSMASDDPEGYKIYSKILKKHADLIKKRDLILLTTENSILVNALQRQANVVIQKSTREGFGLTVTEALWKGKPVVASNIGGIPLQIHDGESGFLIEPHDKKTAVEKIISLLENPDMGIEMGEKGKEHVRKNFLIVRLLENYLDLLSEVIK